MPTTRPFGRSVDPVWLMAFSLMVSLWKATCFFSGKESQGIIMPIQFHLEKCKIQKLGPWSWNKNHNWVYILWYDIFVSISVFHFNPTDTKSPWLKAALRSFQSHHPPRHDASVCRHVPRSPPNLLPTFRWLPRHHPKPLLVWSSESNTVDGSESRLTS